MNEKKLKQLFLVKRLLFVTIIAYVALFFLMNTSYLSIDNMRRFAYSAKTALTQTSASTNDVITYSSGNIPFFSPFKDGITVLGDSSISVYSRDNIRFSVHSVNYRNPVLRVSDEYILCFDRGGKKLSVYNSFDLLFEKEFSDVIINADIDDSGRIAVITEKYGYKGQLTVFNTSFEERFLWYSADSYLVDVAFTSTNSVSVVSVVQNMENIDTVVYSLNYSAGEERAKVVSQSTFPISVSKKNDGSVEILSETGLISFRSGGCNTVYSYGSRVPYKFHQSDKYTVFAYDLNTPNKHFSVYVTDITGNKQFETIVENVKSVSAFSDTIFVLTSEKLLAFDRTGTVVSEISVSEGVTDIVAGKQKCILYGSEKAYIVSTAIIVK